MGQNIQDDVENKKEQASKKIVSYAMKLAEFSEEEFKKMLQSVYKDMSRSRPGKCSGKCSTVTVQEMVKSGKKIESLDTDMLPAAAKRFYREAAKKGIHVSMLKDNSTVPPGYSVLFYNDEIPVVKKVMEETLRKEAERIKKSSLKKNLKRKKDYVKTKGRKSERQKDKQKDNAKEMR